MSQYGGVLGGFSWPEQPQRTERARLLAEEGLSPQDIDAAIGRFIWAGR